MKRLLFSAAFVLFCIGGLLAILPFLVSSDAVRERIRSQAVQITGREMSFRDAPKVLFNPFLGIEINSVIFEDPFAGPNDPPLLQMERLRGQLDLFSALFGRAEIKLYQFIRPKFHLRVYDDGNVGWHFPEGKVWDALKQARDTALNQGTANPAPTTGPPPIKLGEFEIIDGTVEYEDRATQTREVITNINSRIIWPNTAGQLAISGSSIWRDEAFEFSMRSNKALMLFAGGGANLEFSAKSGAFVTSFSGTANTLSDVHLTGSFQFKSPSLTRVADFLDRTIAPGSTLAGLEAQGQLVGTLHQWQLNDAIVVLDGNRGRGVIQVAERRGARSFINGTLAFDTLDFTPYFASLLQDIEIGKNTTPASDLLDLVDMDLRLSANLAKAGKINLSNFAASLSIQNGATALNVGSANLFGGTLVGEIALSETATGNAFKSSMRFSGFDAALASAALGKSQLGLSGTATANIKVDSTGSSTVDLSRNLKGDVAFEITRGAVSGIDMAAIRSAVAATPVGTDTLEPGGLTSFELLTGNFAFSRSSAWIRSMYLFSPVVSAQIAGRSALDLGAIALRLRIAPPVLAADRALMQEAGFPNDTLVLVGGSAANPLVTAVPIIGGSSGQAPARGAQIGN